VTHHLIILQAHPWRELAQHQGIWITSKTPEEIAARVLLVDGGSPGELAPVISGFGRQRPRSP
jgi:hypothetical protein